MVNRSLLNAPLFSLALLVGCNAMFDIEEGTLVEGEAGDAGAGGSSAAAGKGGAGGKGGSSGGKGGSSGAATGGGGGADASGGSDATGGADATGGDGGSTSGAGGASSGNGGSAGTTGGVGGTAGSAGTGAAGDGVGIPELEDCSCDSGAEDSDPNLVQDFENRNAGVLMRGGRDGGFYAYPAWASPAAALECTGQTGNCVALCISGELDGSGYPHAGLGFTLHAVNGDPLPYDLTSFSGVGFTVKGNIPTTALLRVDVTTVATSPTDLGGSCMPAEGLLCNDHYKSEVMPPTPTYEAREVRFVNVGQGNGGGQWTEHWSEFLEANWDPEQALNVNIQVSSTDESQSHTPYDFCIDDIKLLGPEARTTVQHFGFESDAEVVGQWDVQGSQGTASVTRDTTTRIEGDSALAADLTGAGTGMGMCGGTPEDATPSCEDLDDTACSATPGCLLHRNVQFALIDPPIEPGDTVGTWFYLPVGEVHWINVYTLSGISYTWSAVPLTMPARRGEWFYGEFLVPATVNPDIVRFGFQLAVSPTFSGTMYLDDMTVYRPE